MKTRGITNNSIARLKYFVTACLLMSVPLRMLAADYPAWWTNSAHPVITNVVVTNDFAAVNAGQLKWFATNAYDELNTKLAGGAGTAVCALVTGLANSNNFVAINLGQLKAVTALFYDRLIDAGYTNAYPWTASTSAVNDFAMANIGQLKHLFSFDLSRDTDGDGLADWVETGTGIYISPFNTGTNPNSADSDGDGINDGAEVANRTNPNSNDTNSPTVVIAQPVNNSSWMIFP